MKYVALAFLCSILACNTKKTIFEKLASSKTHITFNNTITVSDSLNALKFEYIYNGAGVGIGDFNNDGFSDVFFAGNQVSSKLYQNKGQGNLTFEDVTQTSGVHTSTWCTGVSVVDINKDGKLDIFVSNISPKINTSVPKIFFINQGNNPAGIPIFKESAAELGLADLSYGTQAAFFDFDLDGDLDMYLLTNAMETFNRNNSMGQRTNGEGRSVDKLFRNDGLNTKNGLPVFKDLSKEAGILTEGWGLGIVINDFNADGYPDVYVGNDFLSNDHLYINNKNGTFTNKVANYMQHQSMNSMGLDMADINNDGLNDLVVVDMLPDDNLRQKTMFGNVDYDKYQENLSKNYQPQFVRNVLQVNNGNNTFSDIAYLAGIAATDWSWSPLIADFDNDGLRDIFISNGYRLDVTDMDFIVYRGDNDVFGTKEIRAKKMKDAFSTLKGVKKSNFFYKNKGEFKFENESKNFGLDAQSYTNGTAYADFDNDGDLDLIMNNIDDEAFVYKNNTINNDIKTNHFLRIKLENEKKISAGFGTKITLFADNKIQYAEHQTVRGYKSTVENFVHFGLGNNSKIDSLLVVWPSGVSQILKNPAADKIIVVQEKNAIKKPKPLNINPEFTFEEVSNLHGINHIAEESNYNDFLIQHTLPHKHSEAGPALAVGDVNGDRRDDFFIGGPAHNKGTFFIQNAEGEFSKKDFQKKDEEDVGVLLIDVDNDKDLDLYCVSGSTEFTINLSRYQDRLYLNDGMGNFTLSSGHLPLINSSGGSVTACDYDKDGDLDVFRGGRVKPTQYPSIPESYLLENKGNGHFISKANIANGLSEVGMVSSSLWTDVDNDTWPDLLLVGEFMPITIFKNNMGKNFTKISLKNSNGWWNSINAGDMDNDGDMDYILGNLGLNSKLKASESEPVSVYAKDFDKEGTMDPLLTSFNAKKEYLVHPRGTLIDQLIAMRKRFKTYKEYGETEFANAIPEVDLKGAQILRAYNFANTYLENLGKGEFKLHNLPIRAQFAPIFGTILKDINHDGNLDILAVGNDFSTEVLTGRYDAGIGDYMEGDGKGNFKNVSVSKSNFLVRGDAKALAQINLSNGFSLLLVSQNKGKILAFKEKNNTKISAPPKRKTEYYFGSGYLSQSSYLP
jgi:enediyne biosynthesis protein E4